MKYIVYLTLCIPNNKIYIGVHETENPDKFDGYLGNGVFITRPASYKKSKTPFQYAVNKYGIKNFKRITLSIFDTKEEAYLLEKQLVNKEFLQRPDTYNIKIGGEGGCPETAKVKVYMYDQEGNFVREFNTVYECNKFFIPSATSGGHVPRAIKLGHLFFGYQLSYTKVEYMKKWSPKQYARVNNLPKVPYNKEYKPIGRYTMEGVLLQKYNCLSECIKDGYRNAKEVIKGNRKHCKGYLFKYI